jgi:1-acyl-sn-glycerol-3-phosphate acyltransferase
VHSRLVYGVSKWTFFLLCKLWFRLRYEGKEQVPRTGPLLLIANHGSFIDPPLAGMGVPRFVAFLAKVGLSKLGPMRWWLRQVGVSLIDRSAPSKEVLRRLTECLAAGEVVCMFPEGTRSHDGCIGPFRSGVELLVRRTGATVLPVGIDGSFRAFPRGAKLPRPARCTVRYGAPWPAERVLAPGGIDALRAEVARLARAPLRERPQEVGRPSAHPTDPRSSASAEA